MTINEKKVNLIKKFISQNHIPVISLIEKEGKFYSLTDDSYTRNHIAVEIEFNLSPRTTEARLLEKALEVEAVQTISHLNCSRITTALFNKLSRKNSPWQNMCFQPKGVHMDGNLIEFPFKPMTLSAHKDIYPIYQYLIYNMLQLGCTNALGTNGLHLYLDTELFGQDPRQAVAYMLRLCFENYDWLVEFSGRPHIYSTNADIPTMLKDRWRRLNDTEFRRAFMNTKDAFLNALDDTSVSEHIFNVGINNHPDTLEIRWFATPDNGLDLMAKIEGMHALATFSSLQKADVKPSLEEFCKFVYDNLRTYQNLWVDLHKNSYTKNICLTISSLSK